MSKLYPMIFSPVLKDYIWGGRNLEKQLGRELPPGKVAESWEIAGHDDGTTAVANGRYRGKLLTEVHEELGLDLIGTRNSWAQERDKFPLLIKLLDANRPLSVQVHPDDEYALKHEGNELGKTEMWVVLHAEAGARVIVGVKRGTTPGKFRQALEEGQLERFLHEVPVKTGDHICVPAGSLHAIMGGLILAEIQQNSNTTYRVYDWNRLGADGKPRPLHVQQAMDVINFDQVEPTLTAPEIVSDSNGIRRLRLCQNRYFTVEQVEMAERADFTGRCDGSTFEIWGVVRGSATVRGDFERLELSGVKFGLLPAALGEFQIASDGFSQLLRAFVDRDASS